MILESERRRDTFQGASVPIVLADGQAWCFPKPFVQLTPRIEGRTCVSVDTSTHFGAEFDALMTRLSEAESMAWTDLFSVAAFLLMWNYELSGDEMAGLLCYRHDDPESHDRLNDILDVALGNAPKVSAAGAGSPQ